MCTIIMPAFPYRGENQYGDVDAAECMPPQCGDLETIWSGTPPKMRPPVARKVRPGRLELSGGYAIVGLLGDFISFAARTSFVEKATNG
jgi:hypothetical protein